MGSPETHKPETNSKKRNRFLRGAAIALSGVAAIVGPGHTGRALADDAPATPNTPTATTPDTANAPGLPVAPVIPVEGVPATPDTPIVPTHHIKIEIPKHLRTIAEVSKDKTPVKPEIVQKQIDATAVLMERPINSAPDTPYQPSVSGVLVKAGQKIDFFTSAHELGVATASSEGSVTSTDPSIKAINYNSRVAMEYAIGDPKAPLSYRLTHPIAYVTKENVAADGTDAAALELADSNVSQTEGRTLSTMKPLDGLHIANEKLEPGAQVSLVSMTEADGYKLRIVTGTYVGMEKTYYPKRYVDVDVSTGQNTINSGINQPKQRRIIAIKAPWPSKDASNFGGSGASTFTNYGPVGFVNMRNSIGYGPDKKMQNLDQSSLADNKEERLMLEKQYDVNLPEGISLYAMDVLNPDTVAALLHGDATQLPPVPTDP